MSSTIERLIVKISVDGKDAQKGMGGFSKAVSKATKPAAAVGAALAAMAVKAGNSASRLEQSGGAIDTVFGKNADAVKAWAKAADQSVGLSESAYGELAAGIGAQLNNLGTPLDQVAGKTNDLIGIGADLAATYGGTTADAVAALGSALRGETDPIEKYGIAIKQATIEAKVGKGNLKGMTDEQAKQAKTAATLSLITEQAGGALGAFARESDTAAGQQQRAAAAMEDTSATLGAVFLPVMAAAAKALATFAKWAEKNKTLVLVFSAVLATLAAAILATSAALKIYNMVTKVMAIVSKAAWLSALGPIALVIAAVVAVVAIVVILWNKFEGFRNFVIGVWNAIKVAAVKAWSFIKQFVIVALKVITLPIRTYLAIGKMVFNGIRIAAVVAFNGIKAIVSNFSAVFRNVFNSVKAFASNVFRAMATGAKSAFQVVVNALTWLRDNFANILKSIKAGWDRVFESLASIAKRVLAAVLNPIDAIKRAFERVVGAIQSVINWISKLKFPSPPGWLSKLPGVGSLSTTTNVAAASTVRGLGGGLVPAGHAVTTSGGGIVINVQGAIDPVAVAGQIRRILRDDDRRRGRLVPSGATP